LIMPGLADIGGARLACSDGVVELR
jgi:hypothetical protein